MRVLLLLCLRLVTATVGIGKHLLFCSTIGCDVKIVDY